MNRIASQAVGGASELVEHGLAFLHAPRITEALMRVGDGGLGK
jgi:hypothetical protein